jgi:hypothetical protein
MNACISKYVKRELNMGNDCYSSIRNVSHLSLLCESTQILHVFLTRVPGCLSYVCWRDLRRGRWAEYRDRCVMSSFTFLYTLPHTAWVMKLRRMGWPGHAAHIGNIWNAYTILVGKSEVKTLGEVDIENRIKFRSFLRKWIVGLWTELVWFRAGDRPMWTL